MKWETYPFSYTIHTSAPENLSDEPNFPQAKH
jgi:hypothetical protein